MIRRGGERSDQRLRSLLGLARALTRTRGHLSSEELGSLAGGLDASEVLEVIAQIGSTTLAALTHNLTGIPLDEAFQSREWSVTPSHQAR